MCNLINIHTYVHTHTYFIRCAMSRRATSCWQKKCVCVCFFPFILDIKFVGRTRRGDTGGRSHRISHPPSFCGACLNFSREKDLAIPFPSSTVKSNFVY